MKLIPSSTPPGMVKSLPSRGAWIEIAVSSLVRLVLGCRSPHGERGLKSRCRMLSLQVCTGRSPHGERGLKFVHAIESGSSGHVAPLTGSVD